MKAAGTSLSIILIAVCPVFTYIAAAAAGSVLTVDLNSGRKHIKVGTVEAEVDGDALIAICDVSPSCGVLMLRHGRGGVAGSGPAIVKATGVSSWPRARRPSS